MNNRSSFNKTAWRRRNLAFILQSSGLIRDGKLVSSYVEMLGDAESVDKSDIKMFTLIEPYLQHPQQFIGVEGGPAGDVAVAFRNRLSLLKNDLFEAKPDDRFVKLVKRKNAFDAPINDFFATAMDASRYTSDPASGRYSAAVYNVDETRVVGSDGWWQSKGRLLVEMVNEALSRYGESVLILNHTLNRPATTAVDRLIEQTRVLSDLFTRRGLRADMILGRNYEDVKRVEKISLPDPSTPSRVGGYEVYRSEGGKLRMATLRLRIRESSVFVDRGFR